MQGGLSPTDKKLLLWGAALAFLMTAGTVAFAPPGHGSESKVPSTYSSDPGGARAAYLLLQNLNYPVRRWEEAPTRLPEESDRAVLIIGEPTQMPSASERAALFKFVAQGGRILFCGNSIRSFFIAASISESSPGQEWIQLSADLPSPFTRGAPKITMEPKSYWTRLRPEMLGLYGGESAPAVVTWRLDRGELLWWAAATPLTNAGITQTNNLNLFLNAVSQSTAAGPLDIYWDEYFHGSRGSLWSYAAATPVKWAVVQLALIASAVIFAFARRWGPIAFPRPVSRLSPLEFVDTLGGLYQRAGATSVAVAVAYRHLRLSLTRRLSLPSTISDVMLAGAARERLGWDGGQLATTLEKAVTAQARNLRPSEGLPVLQDIAGYTARLASRPTIQDKH